MINSFTRRSFETDTYYVLQLFEDSRLIQMFYVHN